MESFYTEIGVTSATQRLTSPQSFMKDEWRWSELGNVKVFDYAKFYGHLAQVYRSNNFPRAVNVQDLSSDLSNLSEFSFSVPQIYEVYDRACQSFGLLAAINVS